MTYLLIVETANVVVEFGIIFQPLIIQFGPWLDGCLARLFLIDF